MLNNFVNHIFINDVSPVYDYGDSIDDSSNEFNDEFDYFKNLKLILWFNKYNQCKG